MEQLSEKRGFMILTTMPSPTEKGFTIRRLLFVGMAESAAFTGQVSAHTHTLPLTTAALFSWQAVKYVVTRARVCVCVCVCVCVYVRDDLAALYLTTQVHAGCVGQCYQTAVPVHIRWHALY